MQRKQRRGQTIIFARLGNNRRVKTRAILLQNSKNKNNEPYLRGASPIVLFSFPLCHYYISLLSSHDALLRVTINSAEKLESFFDAMITHVAEEGYFLSALIKP